MTKIILLEILAVILLILLTTVKGIRLERPNLTEFELARRLKDDATLSRFIERLPYLQALQNVATAQLLMLLTATFIANFGFLWGILLSIVAYFGLEIITRRKWIQTRAEKLFKRYQAGFITLTYKLKWLLKYFRPHNQVKHQPAFFSKSELLQQIDHDSHVLKPNEKLILIHALLYGQTTIKDLMTRRPKIVTVDADEILGPVVLDRLHKTGHSNFPVTDGDIDHVVGMLYLSDLVPLKLDLTKIKDAMSPQVSYLNQDQTLDHALHAFLRTRHHLFIVVNEFKEVVGILAIEDIIRQLLGRKVATKFDQYNDLEAVAATKSEEEA